MDVIQAPKPGASNHAYELSDFERTAIKPKRNRKDAICFRPYLYRTRNLVEWFFNKIKQMSACHDPIRQIRGKLFGIHQACINPNLAAC